MRIFLSCFIVCLFITSCGNGNKVKIPKDVISSDTMVDVLTDIHLVKAAQQMGMVLNPNDTGKVSAFEYVWQKHHITQEEYQKSLNFYTLHPAVLDSIYENVLNNLNKERAELQAKRHLK